MKSKKTWVLVADAGHARVLEQSSQKSGLAVVEGLDIEHPIAKSSDMVRDALPRTFDSVGPGRHAIAPKSDPHRAEKKNFAKELALTLDAGLAKKAYDDLIIVAPPQMIGDLRPLLSDAVRSRLTRELRLDLADAPLTEIARRLAEAKGA
ncbi:host attachment protein [Hyphomicrobium sp. CS1GBMeth3]|uniref:host attachment protein n=1 Tax=Hyphomicrobium sp. CS1GBMeth3 TaxID=1892845 RepID=UPI000931F375|nr:host attachment protein [Hyphomicrobium sp. CS1GBMeth3]